MHFEMKCRLKKKERNTEKKMIVNDNNPLSIQDILFLHKKISLGNTCKSSYNLRHFFIPKDIDDR